MKPLLYIRSFEGERFMACQETWKSHAAYAPLGSDDRMRQEQKQEQKQTVKVGEERMSNGLIVEHYCPVDGPTIEECMERVMQIAANALLRKIV